MYHKRPFTTHADRLRPRLESRRLPVAGPAADALRAAGVDAVHVYHDFASGVRDDRPGLNSCVRALRTGDVLVVWKLDRLGRTLAHLVNTVQDLSARDVGLRVLTGQGAQIDTTTAAGRLVFGIFAALAEFERELDSTTQRRCAAGCGERCSPAGARESNPSTVEGSLVGRGRDDGGWRAKFCGPVGGVAPQGSWTVV